MTAQYNGIPDSTIHSTVGTTVTNVASQKAAYSLFNVTTPDANVSSSVAESKIAGGGKFAFLFVDNSLAEDFMSFSVISIT